MTGYAVKQFDTGRRYTNFKEEIEAYTKRFCKVSKCISENNRKMGK